MSLPTFPAVDPELDFDHALNMILTSIAMEELALSHIMNAEGEKLQYVLGTLPSGRCKTATTEEILKVNQSITDLLNTVSQNQILLKNKMDKALSALSDRIWECPPKCNASFKNLDCKSTWRAGCLLPWELKDSQGSCVRSLSCDKTKIEICSKGRFLVSFAINVTCKNCCECALAIHLQASHDKKCDTIFNFHGHILCNQVNTISMSNIIVDTTKGCAPFLLSLKLLTPDILCVEDALLTIIEI